MKRFLRNTAWILAYRGLLILSLMGLTACSHQTTISEGTLYLQAQAQQVQINSYKSQLQATKSKLTQVIPSLQDKNPKPPVSLLGDLTLFLNTHDCSVLNEGVRDQCYRITRVRLIETTRALDEANANKYAAQKTVNQLVGNINVLVDSLVDPTSVPVKPKPK